MARERIGLSLLEGVLATGMSNEQVWLAQIGLGGPASELEVEAYVLGLLRADPYQHNLIAQALNEHFIDRGQNHPVRYLDP